MNNVDYIEDISGVETCSLVEKENKGSLPVFGFASSVFAITADGESSQIDSSETDKEVTFLQNLKYWDAETRFSSTNNFDNAYFREIVNMGKDSVPFIVEELKKGPTPLVHALDEIFPDVIKYEGFVSLKDACEKWLSILR